MSARSRRPLRLLAACLLAAALAACTSTPQLPQIDVRGIAQRAEAAQAEGDFRTAASLYRQLAAQTSGATRVDFLLSAAQAEIELGNLLSARDLLTGAGSGATEVQLDRAQLLLARVELAENQPQQTLQRVAPLLQSQDTAVRTSALELQGLALFAVNRPTEAIAALAEREVWLDDIDVIRANQQALWQSLRSIAPDTAPTDDAIVDGWLALIPAARMGASDAQRRELLQWRQQWRQHPAARILLTDLLIGDNAGAAAPRQIALLLPLGSGAREPARAIRDGFFAAHLAGRRADRPFAGPGTDDIAIRVYDTAAEGAESAYLRAQLEGADFVVGPLIRTEVDAVLEQSGLVPTLVLNHTLSDEAVFANTYQFALAPEDEAAAVARRAIALGQTRAVALVPSNDRGYRIYNSFVTEYEALGGEVLSFMGYDNSIATYSERIQVLLNLDRSNARERTLQANLRETLEFTPRRRRDIDMVFLIGNATSGRLLAPQLEYFYAGDIPTYAISEIFDPAAETRQSDLNRVIFPYVPWLIAPDSEALQMRRTIDANWSERSMPMAQFFGMGIDSYEIVRTLYRDPFFTSIDGASGMLRMDALGRIHRDLPFAQFRGGFAELLDTPLPDAVEAGDPQFDAGGVVRDPASGAVIGADTQSDFEPASREPIPSFLE